MKGINGDEQAEDSDENGTDNGKVTAEYRYAGQPTEKVAAFYKKKSDNNQYGSEAKAEGTNKSHSQPDPMQRDCRKQQNEGRRAGEKASGYTQAEDSPPGDL